MKDGHSQSEPARILNPPQRPMVNPSNASKNINEDEIKRLSEIWMEAPEWNRQLVIEVREPIVKALLEYSRARHLPITRAEYQFAELYNQRAISELSDAIYGKVPHISAGNIGPLRRLYERFGPMGLLTGYGKKRGKVYAIPPGTKLFIAAQVKLNPGIRPVRIHEMLCKLNDRETTPSLRTIGNFMKSEWTGPDARRKEEYTCYKDPTAWKNSYLPAFGDMAADVPHFGHTWEQDSTKNDVVTSDGMRYAVIVTIDVYSRRRKIVFSPTSKSLAIAACTRECLLDWGIPKRVRKDNGQDYRSQHVDAFFSVLDVETPRLRVHAPEQKPFVERVIGAFECHVAEILPGYCGHSVSERQAIRERAAWAKRLLTPGEPVRLPLSINQLKDIADNWIKITEKKPHRGLRGKTPLQMSQESRQQPQRIRDERVVDLLLAPIANRTVQKKGIELDGAFYTSVELVDSVGKKVHIKRDLVDAGLIYVFEILDQANGSFRFVCKARDEALSGQTLEDYMAARNRKQKVLREKARALETLSRTTPEPYTVLLDEGCVSKADDSDKVVPFQAEADLPGVTEIKKAFEEPAKAAGVAQELGRVIDFEERLTRQEKRASRPDQAEGDKWAEMPKDIWDFPPRMFDWFKAKEDAVGLKREDIEHREHLKREFPSHYLRWLDMEEEMKRATLAMPPMR